MNILKAIRFQKTSTFAMAGVVVASSIFATAGCTFWLQPGSQGYENSKQVWSSKQHLPTTLRLVDTISGDALWECEIPAGKWLVTRFFPDGARADDPEFPDLLKFKVVKAGTNGTLLKNSVDVPSSEHRRWELVVRDTVEISPPPMLVIEDDDSTWDDDMDASLEAVEEHGESPEAPADGGDDADETIDFDEDPALSLEEALEAEEDDTPESEEEGR